MNLSQWNQGKDKAIRKADQTINSTTNERQRKEKQNSCAEYLLNIGVLEQDHFQKNYPPLGRKILSSKSSEALLSSLVHPR